MPWNVKPFRTKSEVVRFAATFVKRRVKGFSKDIDICLTGDKNDDKAFMPGLMATISLLDLLSGLYDGKVAGHSHNEFIKLVQDFLPGRYDAYELTVLYVAFRHKLSHLSHPYFVLNTANDKRLKTRAMLLSWQISSDAHEPPISITRLKRPRLLRRQPVPWKTRVDHYMHVSIRTLANDAIEISRLYIEKLRTDRELWKKFQRCVKEFYQT